MSTGSHRKNPFKGLQPFEQEDEDRLFGRERDLILIKDRILSSRTTLLFAGSGVGKTSFLNAAVIPELSKRYCVVWHNRWTGAEERSDADLLNDRPPFKLWPPRAFASWLTDAVLERFWLRRKMESESEIETKKAAKIQEKFVGDVQDVISHSLKPGNGTRLSTVLSVFKKEAKSDLPSENRKKGCMLILDQFEEVFQYHAYQDYFDDFLSDLSEIINDEDYQVRVVFSMREEFLGELSVFDNRIPDLFNNYYRLRDPKRDEAKHIITETCRWVNVKPHPENLDKLVKDLSTFETSNTAEAGAPPVRVMQRDFVPPPYLQIVCYRLWKEQYKNCGTPVVAGENGGTQKEIGHFLENYKTVSDPPVEGEESDAQRAVREFCEAKLSPPYLTKWEQSLAARAFEFLVTKQGAKMAYELRSLASHMDERVWALKQTLQKLSHPDARILRESRPEGSYWFELYHDMYAGVVDRWKRRYRRERRRRQQRRALAFAGIVAAAILLPLAFINWVQRPWSYQTTISEYAKDLDTTDLKNDYRYDEVFKAYSKLEDTLGYAGKAHTAWAKVWERRGQLFAAKEQRDEAVICLLQAATLTEDQADAKDYMAQANNLLLGNENAIEHTFCRNCRLEAISQDARHIATSAGGRIAVSDLTSTFISAQYDNFTGVAFSADGDLVAVARTITEDSQTNPRSANRGSPNEASSGGPAAPTPTRGSEKKVVGWEVTISPTKQSDPDKVGKESFIIRKPRLQVRIGDSEFFDSKFELKAFTPTNSGFLVAGVLNQRLVIWKQDGSEFASVVPQGYAFNPTFSRDGKFFLVSGWNVQEQLWEIKETGLSPVPEISKLLTSSRWLEFSPDGTHLLVITDTSVKLWDMRSKQEVLSIATPDGVVRAGFAPRSNTLIVAEQNGKVTAWDSATLKEVFPVRTLNKSYVAFGKYGKTLVLSTSRQSFTDVFEKWSLETGKLIGELEMPNQRSITYVTGNGDSLLIVAKEAARRWRVPPVDEGPTNQKLVAENVSFAGLSTDGNIVLVLDYRPLASGLFMFRVLNVSDQKELFSFSSSPAWVALSPKGNRVALQTGAKEIAFFSSTPGQPPQKVSFDSVVTRSVFSSDGRFLANLTEARKLYLFDSASGASKQFDTEVDGRFLMFTPDSQYLLISAQDSTVDSFATPGSPPAGPTVELWSVLESKKIPLHLDQKARVAAVALSNDRVVMSQNKKILVFNNKTGERVSVFDYPSDLAFLALSKDSKFVVTCDQEGVVQLWDAVAGKWGFSASIGSPAKEIIFEPGNSSFVLLTGQWLHRIEIVDEDELRYSRGIFTGDFHEGSLRIEANTPSQQSGTPSTFLRWPRYRPRGLQIHRTSFFDYAGQPVLDGEPGELLTKWQSKLGIEVRPDGYLAVRSSP